MKNLTQIVLVLTFLLSAFGLQAQQTGKFLKTIDYMDEQRKVHMYVPDEYNEAESYRLMICLHGLGDNSANYSNVLLSNGYQNYFPMTIFAFIDGGSDQMGDFYSPEYDQYIIDTVMAQLADEYNINLEETILQGFSLGGRSALVYGLEYPEKFQGLLLHTPAVQGPKDVMNLYERPHPIRYDNAGDLNIYIGHGSEDVGYYETNNMLYDSLIANNANVVKEEFENMGHTIPIGDGLSNIEKFISNGFPAPKDIEFLSIEGPDYTCQESIIVTLRLRNTGQQAIESFEISSIEPEGILITDIDGLAIREYKEIEVELSGFANGKNVFEFMISKVDGEDTEGTLLYDDEDYDIVYYESGIAWKDVDFEDIDALDYWFANTTGNPFGWTPSISNPGNTSLFSFNWAFYFDTRGISEELTSPIVDLTSSNAQYLSFDVAYNYHKFEPPIAQQEFSLTDTLEVYGRRGCNEELVLLYKKSGSDLATRNEPIINPSTIDAAVITPTAKEWRTEHIELDESMKAATMASFVFKYTSGQGGILFLDNIRMQLEPTSVASKSSHSNINIYPNPASDFVEISFSDASEINKISILNIAGQEIMSLTASEISSSDTHRLSVGNLAAGAYIVRVWHDGFAKDSNLLINR